MPEGDTIHRAAATLRPALVGQPLERFDAPRLPPPFPEPGVDVTSVEARGKHLLIRFGDGHVLHTHLRMTGSWHLYRPGERWQRSRRAVRAVVAVPDAVAVCFDAPVVELLDDAALLRHPGLQRLGPDLCLPDPDLDEAVRRFAALPAPDAPVVTALLDQRVAAGIGNVYASELCFLERVHPTTPVHAVPAPVRRALLERGGILLRRNLATVRRTTVPNAPDGSLWVYGRAGQACRRCGTPIEADRIGEHARITYWCPACQPAGTDHR